MFGVRNENSTGECRAAMDELAGLCLTEFPRLIAKCFMSGSLVYEFITLRAGAAGPGILGVGAHWPLKVPFPIQLQ